MHKGRCQSSVSVWWIFKYEIRRLWIKQKVHYKYHDKTFQLLHQGKMILHVEVMVIFAHVPNNIKINAFACVSLCVCQFAAVQFSKVFKTVFDFNDYQKGFAEKKLMNEPHMNSLTNTHGAINFTLWVTCLNCPAWFYSSCLVRHRKHKEWTRPGLRIWLAIYCSDTSAESGWCGCTERICLENVTMKNSDFWFRRDLLLNNVSSGANPNATKALVIITDGDPSDNDDHGVIKKCDAQNILRYIIGVSFCQKMYS